MNGKTCKGSAHSGAPGLHLLSAVTHAPVTTIAQVEVGSKTNETRCRRPLLAPQKLAGTIVTIHALHSVKATITRLVTAKKAHYIAVLKTNQPTPHRQLTALPWSAIPVPHTASPDAHGRRESRSIKTCAIADTFGGINFPHAHLAGSDHTSLAAGSRSRAADAVRSRASKPSVHCPSGAAVRARPTGHGSRRPAH